MKSIRDTLIAAGLALGITLSLMVSITLTVLFASGWKTEQESSDTVFSAGPWIRFERRTDRRVQAGGNTSPEDNVVSHTQAAPSSEPAPAGLSEAAPHVGGSYVSARSTMRYVIDDSRGRVEMYGYDVMRGRRVFVGSGWMTGRELVIPNFYSFLDDTHGTLKLRLSADDRTFEGVFEGMNATQRGAVTLIRLP